MDEENKCEDCAICAEPFTDGGEHKPVSIKCGHIFGEKCIKRWFHEFRKRTCPICKARIQKNQIRPVFGYNIRVVEGIDINEVKEELEKERNARCQLEREKRCAEEELEYAVMEMKRLKKCLKDAETEIEHLKNGQNASTVPNQSQFAGGDSPFRVAGKRLLPQECTCFAMTKNLRLILADQRRSQLKQVNAATGKVDWTTAFQQPGLGFIWDIQASPDDSQVCIAIGKQLCLRSLKDLQATLNFQVEDSAVLSCAWHGDGHQVYAGLGNGTVKHYDLRRPDPKESVSVLKCPHQHGIHSLISCEGKIYGCTGQTVVEWDDRGQAQEISTVEGSIESMSYDPTVKLLALSVRPSSLEGQAMHELISLEGSTHEKLPSLFGHKSFHTKSRGCFVPHSGSSPYFASGDESDNSVCLWDVNSNTIMCRIPCCNGPLKQIQCQKAYGTAFLCTLTQSSIAIHSLVGLEGG